MYLFDLNGLQLAYMILVVTWKHISQKQFYYFFPLKFVTDRDDFMLEESNSNLIVSFTFRMLFFSFQYISFFAS